MASQITQEQLIQMIKAGQNPQQIVMSLLSQNANSPMFANLLQLAKDNKIADVEQIARNLAKERGLDYDKEFGAFKQFLGLQ